MKLAKKIILSIISVLLGLMLLFNIYNFICLNILKQDLPTINGYAVLEVVSGSMEPTIKVGDLIVIDTKTKEYRPKDIVTFYDVNGEFVTHRIIDIDEKEMVTKGDNKENSIDEPTSVDKIVGKYLFKLNGLGILIASFKSPLVMVAILIIGVLVCFLVSTDKEGNPILEADEEEFLKFQEMKNESVKKEKLELKEEKEPKKQSTKKKTSSKKEPTSSKNKTIKKDESKKTAPAKKTTTTKKASPKEVIKENKGKKTTKKDATKKKEK